MGKLNSEKANRDLRTAGARLAALVAWILYGIILLILAVGVHLSARVLLDMPKAFLWFGEGDNVTAAFKIFVTLYIAVLIPSLFHFRKTHDEPSLRYVLQRFGRSNSSSDRRLIIKYLSALLIQGGVALIAGDLACLFACSILGTNAFLVCFISWLMGVGIALLLFYLRSWFRADSKEETSEPASPVIRGTLLNTFAEAKKRALALIETVRLKKPSSVQYVIPWGGINLPGDTESHFGIVGISGSGKTLALQALMRAVIPTVRESNNEATARRALVFDPENKFIPFLQTLAGEDRVHILNPFDRRSRPWDLANDVEDLATAQEMASIFIPEQKGDSQPFWQRTARGILSAVLKSLHMKARGKWTLRHVFHIMTNESRLTAVLKATNQTQGLIDLLKPTNQTLFNVLAELRSHMDMLEIIAALWDNSVKVHRAVPFTLNAWLDEQSVLVFGRPTHLEDTVLALNRVIVKRASQLIRAPMTKAKVAARGRTWIFLDELRNIGNLPGLDKLLTEGRSRGARVAMTFQDIDGLREVYNERIAEEITNQCDTMSYLRCRGTTAKWGAERMGRCEYWDRDFHSGSSSTSGQSASYTASSGVNTKKNVSDAVFESQLSGLPSVEKRTVEGKDGGFVQGWHVVSALECIYSTGKGDAWLPFENVETGMRFEERLPEDQILRPWDDDEDWGDLGFRPDLTTEPSKMPDVDSLRG